jgi:polyisoprenyl-phosphate glycosyltransferase
MAPQHTYLTVIVPAYDEEEVLPHFHGTLCRVLEALPGRYEWEILYIDDGSQDGTLDLLRLWAGTDPRVRYVSLSRNFGHQAAFTAGLENACGDVVVLIDADLQHPPALIPYLLGKWREGFDVVRAIRARTVSTGWGSRLFARLFHRLSETPVAEGITDFCLLSRRAVTALLQMRETHRFLRGLVGWLGFPSAEVSFHPAPRRAGVSKFSPLRLAGYALDALLSFSRAPLRVSFFLGLLFLLLGLITTGCLGVSLIQSGSAPGWTAVLASIHLVGGALLCAVGAVGEYVARVYEQVKGRPLYLVKETEADAPQILSVPALPNERPSSAAS